MRDNRKVPAVPPGTDVVAVNRSMAFLAAFAVTASVLFASFYPRPLFLPTLSSMLTLAAVSSATVALLRAHNPFAGHLTLWDAATVLLFLAVGAGLLTDSAAVDAFLRANADLQGAPASSEAASPATTPSPTP